MTVSKSPDRGTFSKSMYIKKLDENPDDEAAIGMIDMYDEWQLEQVAIEQTEEWKQNNLEHDLRSTEWILEKARADEVYAQHEYAALCNNQFQQLKTWSILKDERWSCSWRHAGGIIADMLQTGDYIDWYCSGITGPTDITEEEFNALDDAGKAYHKQVKSYVGEGFVTDEIKEDLHRLGWLVVPDNRGD